MGSGVLEFVWAGEVYVPIDLRVASSMVVVARFHDQADTFRECPIDGCQGNGAVGLARGNRFLTAELRNASLKY